MTDQLLPNTNPLTGEAMPSGGELYAQALQNFQAQQAPAQPVVPQFDPSSLAGVKLNLQDDKGNVITSDAVHKLWGTADAKVLRVPVKDQNGQAATVPLNQLPQALQQGYTLEAAPEEDHRKRIEEAAEHPVQAFLASAANEAGFGLLEPVANFFDPKTGQYLKDLKEANPLASGAGAIGGTALSFLYGGEFLKGAEAAGKAAEGVVKGTSVVSRVARAGVKGAVEGAVLGAPRALAEGTLGDPRVGAETWVAATLGGAVFGAGGAAVGEGVKALGRGAKSLALKVADTAPVQNLAMKGLKNAAGFEAGAGKLPANWTDDTLVEALDVAARKGVFTTDAKTIAKSGVDPTEAVQVRIDRLEQWKKEAGEAIGSALKNVDAQAAAAGSHFDVDPLVASFKNEAKRMLAGSEGSKANVFKSAANDIEQAVLQDGFTLSALHETKLKFAEAARDFESKAPIAKAWKQAYGKLSDAMDEYVGQVGGTTERAAYEAAKKEYGFASELLTASEARSKQVGKNRWISLTDIIGLTGGTNVGKIAGGFVGGVPGVVAGSFIDFGLKLGALYGKRVFENEGRLALGALATGRGEHVVPGLAALIQNSGKLLDEGIQKALTTTVRAVPAVAERMTQQEAADRVKKETAIIQGLASDQKNTGYALQIATAQLRNNGAPDTAAAAQATTQNAINYLNSALPRPPVPKTPFARPVPWNPNPREVAAYERKKEIVVNPMNVVKHLENGTLTQDHVDALNAVYPSYAQAIRNRLVQASKEGVQLPREKRRAVQLLLGPSAQPTGSPQNRPSSANGGTPSNGGKVTQAAAQSLSKAATSYQTETQRISG